MASTIKGINIKLGAETTGLKRALKDVNKRSRDIASELRKVEKLLRFNPNDTALLAQKQKLLADRVDNTRKKLDTLVKSQKQVKKQFEKGEIDEGQYRAFQREVVATKSKLEHFEKQLKQNTSTKEYFKKSLRQAGDSLKSAGQKMTSAGRSLSMTLTPAILGAVTGLGTIANKTAKAGDEIAKMSDRTGFSATTLSELKHAADLSGSSLDSLEKGVKRMQKRIFEAEKGLASAKDAFDALGVSYEDIMDLKPEAQFAILS